MRRFMTKYIANNLKLVSTFKRSSILNFAHFCTIPVDLDEVGGGLVGVKAHGGPRKWTRGFSECPGRQSQLGHRCLK